MSSTFFGLSIAGTGLNAFKASVETTTNNISNVNTKGYSKQVVNLKSGPAIRTFQKYGNAGTGVVAESVTQNRDQYFDEKYWNNNAQYGLYDKKLYYMQQIEDYYKDSAAVPGFTRIYTKMFNALDAVGSNAGDTSARNEFLSDARELTGYFNNISNELSELQTTVNDEIKTTVDQVNSIAQKIALMNRQINIIEVEGGHANELRDERALLVDELSKILPVQIKEAKVTNSNFPDMYTGATNYSVTVNGKSLVDTFEYNQLTTVTRGNVYNQSDAEGLYDVAWADTGELLNMNSKTMTGSLKAMFEVRDGNNEENLKGHVIGATSGTITINYPNNTDPLQMNLPVQGYVTVNNTQYPYDGFSVNYDKNGKIESYTFELQNRTLDLNEANEIKGNILYVGSTIDFKGIPYYQNQMNAFLRSFAKSFNDIEEEAQDANGDPAGAVFVAYDSFAGKEATFSEEQADSALPRTYRFTNRENEKNPLSDAYYRLTAQNVNVARKLSDPNYFGTTRYIKNGNTQTDNGIEASDIVLRLQKLQSETKLFRNSGGSDFLEVIYSDMTVDAQECSVFAENYKSIANAIDTQRKSVSGVDEDEEALDLVKFQNAYNLSSKAISVLNQMYDRLITQTGV
jgi:flagellar hook-associated protein 1 FlgK